MEMKAFSLTDQNSGSTARISLYGATVISYITKGHERLFLSQKAKLDGTKAIRGGIPPVFPVFGKASSGPCKDLPQHGFARTHLWRITKQSISAATMTLTPDDLTQEARGQWPYEFRLDYHVSIGKSGELVCALEISNTDTKPFEFQTLLHTYFRVRDIKDVRVVGLKGIDYADKVNSCNTTEEEAEVACISETDRVYPNVTSLVAIKEQDTTIVELERDGLDDVVLWNPWTGCSKMADFGPEDGYKRMVCVEAGAVSKWHKIEPSSSLTVSQKIACP